MKARFPRPTWFSMIYFAALSGIAQGILGAVDALDNLLAVSVVHGLLIPVAVVLGRWSDHARRSETPRIFGVVLSSVGLTTPALTHDKPWLAPAIVLTMLAINLTRHVTGRHRSS